MMQNLFLYWDLPCLGFALLFYIQTKTIVKPVYEKLPLKTGLLLSETFS